MSGTSPTLPGFDYTAGRRLCLVNKRPGRTNFRSRTEIRRPAFGAAEQRARCEFSTVPQAKPDHVSGWRTCSTNPAPTQSRPGQPRRPCAKGTGGRPAPRFLCCERIMGVVGGLQNGRPESVACDASPFPAPERCSPPFKSTLTRRPPRPLSGGRPHRMHAKPPPKPPGGRPPTWPPCGLACPSSAQRGSSQSHASHGPFSSSATCPTCIRFFARDKERQPPMAVHALGETRVPSTLAPADLVATANDVPLPRGSKKSGHAMTKVPGRDGYPYSENRHHRRK